MGTKNKEFEITKEGLAELKKDLKDRKGVIRKKLQDQLDADIQEGDISENTSYYKVQEEIASNDKRVDELEGLIENAQVVTSGTCAGSECKVGVGHTVKMKVKGRDLIYQIVGATEADPTENKISVDSPIGKALSGKKAGDKVAVKTPGGSVEYDIIEVA